MEKRFQMKNRYYQAIAVVFALVLIAVSLFQYYYLVERRKEEMNIQSVEKYAKQSSMVIENELEHYIQFMNSVSKTISKGKMTTRCFMNILGVLAKEEDIKSAGISDKNGKALLGDGTSENIKNEEYFKEALRGKKYVSNVIGKGYKNKNRFIISVPIRVNQKIKGVIFGIVELEKLANVKKFSLLSDNRYIHIIDRSGNYIYRADNPKRLVQDESNFFHGLGKLNTSKEMKEIQSWVKAGKDISVEVKQGKDERYVSLNSLDDYDWYVVSVIDQKFAESSINRLVKNDVIILIMKISGILIACCVLLFVTQRNEIKKMETLYRNLSHNEEIYRIAASRADNILFIYDVKNDVLRFLNGNVEVYKAGEEIKQAQKTLLERLKKRPDAYGKLKYIFENLENIHQEYKCELHFRYEGRERFYLMNVSKLYNDKKEIEQCVGTMQDITKEKELRREAKFDSLTMVYNRKTGEKKVKKILRNEADQTHAFIILDLDRFKHLNDVLGHQYGDRALIEVAEILKNHFYREDIIFRLGGDEFAVLAKGLSAEMMDKVLGSLLRKMKLSYENEYKKVQITVSAGVALYPEHGQSFSQLYEHADKALYHAKSGGRNRWSLSVGEASDLS